VKRKRIFILILAFAIIEIMAIAIGVYPFYSQKPQPNPGLTIRLGIVPEISKSETARNWEIFFKQFSAEDLKFNITPYYANSYEEAIHGFIYGSLDLLYINPLVFMDLEKKYGALPILYHKLPETELDKNRAVIVSYSDIQYIEDTKKKRICFIDKYSLGGYIMPDKFLHDKLKTSPDKWFSDISFAGTKNASFNKFTNKEVDLIATDLWSFEDFLSSHQGLSKKTNILWISGIIPENLICISRNSPYLNSEVIERFKRNLWAKAKKRAYSNIPYNRLSFSFEPIDSNYIEKLKKLSKLTDYTNPPAPGDQIKKMNR